MLSLKSVLLHFAPFRKDHFENYMLFICVFPHNNQRFSWTIFGSEWILVLILQFKLCKLNRSGSLVCWVLTFVRTKLIVSIMMIKHEPLNMLQKKCLLDYQAEKGLWYPPPSSKAEHKDKIRLTAYKNRVAQPHRHNSKETDVWWLAKISDQL